MTITTEQLKERAKFWREKVADGAVGTVVLEQGILMFAEVFEELAEARELLAARGKTAVRTCWRMEKEQEQGNEETARIAHRQL